MPIIFCVHPVILDSQLARKGLALRKSVTLAHVASSKWGVGERGESGVQTITENILVCSPCQVSTTYVTRACQVGVPLDLKEGLTRQERALLYMVPVIVFQVSCSNFRGSVRVQFGKLI
jgi:hypothetical protein